MIRKTVIWGCLSLALVSIVINVLSRHTEVILWGKENWRGGSSNGHHIFHRGEIPSLGSRASFVDGSFLHVRTYLVGEDSSVPDRQFNGVLFRSSQTVDVLSPVLKGSRELISFMLPQLITVRLFVPLWAPCLLFMVPGTGTFLLGPYRRYRRRKKGLCLTCGYDLTGNESGVCPECGSKA